MCEKHLGVLADMARIPNHTSPRGRYCSASGWSFSTVEAQMKPVVIEPEPDKQIRMGRCPSCGQEKQLLTGSTLVPAHRWKTGPRCSGGGREAECVRIRRPFRPNYGLPEFGTESVRAAPSSPPGTGKRR